MAGPKEQNAAPQNELGKQRGTNERKTSMVNKSIRSETHKTAVVTGGSRGLGRNTSLNLATRGVDIIFTYHSNQAEADSLISEVEGIGQKAAAFRLDTAELRGFDAFVAEVRNTLQSWARERFDYLVNNAGNYREINFEKVTEADFDAVVNVHFKGVFFLTQKLLPLMNDGGRIVNISSGLTRFTVPGNSVYAPAKGAIEVLTHYLAKELAPRRITANVAALGPIQTDFGGGMVRDNPEINKYLSAMTALGRPGVPDDVGPMIAALLSDENRWVNGQRIEVSGGIFL